MKRASSFPAAAAAPAPVLAIIPSPSPITSPLDPSRPLPSTSRPQFEQRFAIFSLPLFASCILITSFFLPLTGSWKFPHRNEIQWKILIQIAANYWGFKANSSRYFFVFLFFCCTICICISVLIWVCISSLCGYLCLVLSNASLAALHLRFLSPVGATPLIFRSLQCTFSLPYWPPPASGSVSSAIEDPPEKCFISWVI